MNEQKHLIVGTAGHVDHGKTTLIQAMTGVNTDRLKEERERGLTIDLGFASLKLPGGRVVGIVDVPGHERFIKNMLAGAGGIDIALLVVAADEGVMPQTREHLEILELLEIRNGVVALTKTDTVDTEWIDVVEDDLTAFLKSTSLRNARIIRVSGVTGAGIDELVAEISRLVDEAEQRIIDGPFRLPVDRVFTMTGFGTVVTGTLVAGSMRVGDPVSILPKGLSSRIRQLQSHGEKRDEVFAGSRVAANLVGIEPAEIGRGDVVLPPGHLRPSATIDVSISLLKSIEPLANGTRIRLHIVAAEAIGRIAVLGADGIAPGGKALAQLRLEGPIVCARGDRFVLRLYSPTRLLGGGVVLDPASKKRRRYERAALERLTLAMSGDPRAVVEDAVRVCESGATRGELAGSTGIAEQELVGIIGHLTAEARLIDHGGRVFHAATLEMTTARVRSILSQYHAAHPLKSGMPREALKSTLGSKIDQKGFQSLTGLLETRGEIVLEEATARLPDHRPTLTESQEALAHLIETEYRAAGLNPPLNQEAEARYGAEARELMNILAERGALVKLTPELCFHSEAMERAEKALKEYLSSNDRITVAEFRDLVDSSRKYVVPLLEHFDRRRVTRRAGDVRTLAG